MEGHGTPGSVGSLSLGETHLFPEPWPPPWPALSSSARPTSPPRPVPPYTRVTRAWGPRRTGSGWFVREQQTGEPRAGGLAPLRSGLKGMRTLGPCQVRWLSRPHLTGGGSSPWGSSQPPIPPAVPAPIPKQDWPPNTPPPRPTVCPSRPPGGRLPGSTVSHGGGVPLQTHCPGIGNEIL